VPARPQYSWTRQWYPLAAVDDLDATRPHAAQLLGRRLVLWRDGGGDWRAFEDLCPHRRASCRQPHAIPAVSSTRSYHPVVHS